MSENEARCRGGGLLPAVSHALGAAPAALGIDAARKGPLLARMWPGGSWCARGPPPGRDGYAVRDGIANGGILGIGGSQRLLPVGAFTGWVPDLVATLARGQ